MSDEKLTSLPFAQINPTGQAEDSTLFALHGAQEHLTEGQRALLLAETGLARLDIIEAAIYEVRHTARRTAQRDALLFVLGFASAAVFFLAVVLVTLYWR